MRSSSGTRSETVAWCGTDTSGKGAVTPPSFSLAGTPAEFAIRGQALPVPPASSKAALRPPRGPPPQEPRDRDWPPFEQQAGAHFLPHIPTSSPASSSPLHASLLSEHAVAAAAGAADAVTATCTAAAAPRSGCGNVAAAATPHSVLSPPLTTASSSCSSSSSSTHSSGSSRRLLLQPSASASSTCSGVSPGSVASSLHRPYSPHWSQWEAAATAAPGTATPTSPQQQQQQQQSPVHDDPLLLLLYRQHSLRQQQLQQQQQPVGRPATQPASSRPPSAALLPSLPAPMPQPWPQHLASLSSPSSPQSGTPLHGVAGTLPEAAAGEHRVPPVPPAEAVGMGTAEGPVVQQGTTTQQQRPQLSPPPSGSSSRVHSDPERQQHHQQQQRQPEAACSGQGEAAACRGSAPSHGSAVQGEGGPAIAGRRDAEKERGSSLCLCASSDAPHRSYSTACHSHLSEQARPVRAADSSVGGRSSSSSSRGGDSGGEGGQPSPLDGQVLTETQQQNGAATQAAGVGSSDGLNGGISGSWEGHKESGMDGCTGGGGDCGTGEEGGEESSSESGSEGEGEPGSVTREPPTGADCLVDQLAAAGREADGEGPARDQQAAADDAPSGADGAKGGKGRKGGKKGRKGKKALNAQGSGSKGSSRASRGSGDGGPTGTAKRPTAVPGQPSSMQRRRSSNSSSSAAGAISQKTPGGVTHTLGPGGPPAADTALREAAVGGLGCGAAESQRPCGPDHQGLTASTSLPTETHVKAAIPRAPKPRSASPSATPSSSSPLTPTLQRRQAGGLPSGCPLSPQQQQQQHQRQPSPRRSLLLTPSQTQPLVSGRSVSVGRGALARGVAPAAGRRVVSGLTDAAATLPASAALLLPPLPPPHGHSPYSRQAAAHAAAAAAAAAATAAAAPLDWKEEQRRAQERLEAYSRAKEERSRQAAAEEANRRKQANDARNAQRLVKERQREEIYALNAILRMSEQAFIDQLVEAAARAEQRAASKAGTPACSRPHSALHLPRAVAGCRPQSAVVALLASGPGSRPQSAMPRKGMAPQSASGGGAAAAVTGAAAAEAGAQGEGLDADSGDEEDCALVESILSRMAHGV